MATIHISKAEAERDLAGLLARVSNGTSFLIEEGSEPVALLQAPPTTSEVSAVIDDDFARDIEFAMSRHREPLDSSR